MEKIKLLLELSQITDHRQYECNFEPGEDSEYA